MQLPQKATNTFSRGYVNLQEGIVHLLYYYGCVKNVHLLWNWLSWFTSFEDPMTTIDISQKITAQKYKFTVHANETSPSWKGGNKKTDLAILRTWPFWDGGTMTFSEGFPWTPGDFPRSRRLPGSQATFLSIAKDPTENVTLVLEVGVDGVDGCT